MVLVHRRSFKTKALIELSGIIVDGMHEQYPAGDNFLGSEKAHERVLEECLATPVQLRTDPLPVSPATSPAPPGTALYPW